MLSTSKVFCLADTDIAQLARWIQFFFNRILAIMGNRHDNCFLALPVLSLHFFSIGLYGFVAAIVPATYLLHRSLR